MIRRTQSIAFLPAAALALLALAVWTAHPILHAGGHAHSGLGHDAPGHAHHGDHGPLPDAPGGDCPICLAGSSAGAELAPDAPQPEPVRRVMESSPPPAAPVLKSAEVPPTRSPRSPPLI